MVWYVNGLGGIIDMKIWVLTLGGKLYTRACAPLSYCYIGKKLTRTKSMSYKENLYNFLIKRGPFL